MKQATFQLSDKTDEKIQKTNIQEDTKINIDFIETNNTLKKPIKKVENIYYFYKKV